MKNAIICIIFLVLLAGCDNRTNKAKDIIVENKEPNLFLGIWKSIERDYPYGASLVIREDSSYSFKYGACMSYGFSRGSWMVNDSVIALNSYKKVDTCFYLTYFSADCVDADSLNNYYTGKTTIENCEPEYGIDYVVFDNEEFILYNDTLKHIVKEEKLCPDIKNDFFRIRKDTTSKN